MRRSNYRCRLVLILGLLFSGYSGCKAAEPEKHLLPDGYTGPVVIVFDWSDKQGSIPGEKRRYHVPPDGVLVVQGRPNQGASDGESRQFFYVSKDGSTTRIPDPFTKDKPKPEQVQVFLITAGQSSGWQRFNERTPPKNVSWLAYYVGIPAKAQDSGRLLAAAVQAAVERDPAMRRPSARDGGG